MFLIDDDEPKVGKRGKKGGASPDHERHFASGHSHPLIVSLAFTQTAVIYSQPISEA
jgi:hypothetical protein